MYFPDYVIISPWKRVGIFVSTILNPLNQRMLCAKFRLNWPSDPGKDENVKSVQTDGRTNGQTEERRTTGNQKSSGELKTMSNENYLVHTLNEKRKRRVITLRERERERERESEY